MKYNLIKVIVALFVFSLNAQALTDAEIGKIDKVINNGAILEKPLKSDKNVVLTLFKALVDGSESYALIKIKNVSNKKIMVKDYVAYGKPIKQILAPDELTYILVIDSDKIEKKRELENKVFMETTIRGKIEKNFAEVKEFFSENLLVYSITKSKGEVKIFKIDTKDYKNYIDGIEFLDIYKYTKNNIQNSLYQGYFYSGYETNKDGTIHGKSYYFITDQITNKIGMIYTVNKRLDYEEMKESILKYKEGK